MKILRKTKKINYLTEEEIEYVIDNEERKLGSEQSEKPL